MDDCTETETCTAQVHVHGCPKDDGYCDDLDQHVAEGPIVIPVNALNSSVIGTLR